MNNLSRNFHFNTHTWCEIEPSFMDFSVVKHTFIPCLRLIVKPKESDTWMEIIFKCLAKKKLLHFVRDCFVEQHLRMLFFSVLDSLCSSYSRQYYSNSLKLFMTIFKNPLRQSYYFLIKIIIKIAQHLFLRDLLYQISFSKIWKLYLKLKR